MMYLLCCVSDVVCVTASYSPVCIDPGTIRIGVEEGRVAVVRSFGAERDMALHSDTDVGKIAVT